jgi:succinate dehydrogenase/fumarate reductase flavoprotein subunit
MLLCAESFFRASLIRKESRGWFLREDYPEESKELKWINVQDVDGEMTLTEQPIPIEKYLYSPFKPGYKYIPLNER